MKNRLPVGALLFAFIDVCAEEHPKELQPLIITATRTEQRLDAVLASTTVITREVIERRQAASVQDVLRGVPGIGIVNNGGLGKATSVFMRGTESDHLLVLIDGLRVGSATSGSVSFQDIPIDHIERIEIVRGPRSSLYGSEAIGGVIQIFTRKGEGELTPTFSAGGGTHETYKVSGGLSGTIGMGWYSLNASRLDSSGFNSCAGQPFPPGGGCFTFEDDSDGYTNNSGSARAGYKFGEALEVEGHFLHVEGENDFDGSSVSSNESEIKQQVIGGRLRYSPLKAWGITVSGGRHQDESDNFFKPRVMDTKRVFRSRFDTERHSLTVQNDVSIATDQIVTLGFDYYKDKIDSTEDFAESSRYNKAGFFQYQGSFGAHDVALGLRYDDNEQFGDKVTGNVAWGYTFGDYLRLTAGVGSAFKAPSFNELFFPDFGNPDLGAEESITFEIGGRGQVAGVDWSLTGYYTELDDMIIPVFDLIACSPPFFFCAQNVDEAQILGVEATANASLWGWDMAATVTLIDPNNRGRAKGNVLPRRAQQMFRIDLDRRFEWVSGGVSVYGEGRRFDDLANNERLAGFVLADLRVAAHLPNNFVLEGRVSNLLDRDYETAALFNQDGRNFFFTLRYSP